MFRKGNASWITGLTKETDERVKKISEAMKDKNNPYYGKKTPFYGKHHTEEARKKISQKGKGRIPWNKGIPRSEEDKEKMRGPRENFIPWNKGMPRSEKVKRKISQSHKGVKLSEEHKRRIGQGLKGKMSRENNPLWKGGTSSLQSLIKGTTTYNLWRKAVFIKDHFQCQDCGKIGGDLNAHHLYPFSKLLEDYNIISLGQAIKTEELWDINNGITLCVKCHKKRHKGANKCLKN